MALSTLVQQVNRVRRRLVMGSLLALLAWFWAAALALSAVWFFVGPFLVHDAPEWVRWAVLGGLVGLATLAAVVLSVLRAPSSVSAAMMLDERFGLRERVTTSLTLAPEDTATPAGSALLADAEGRLAKVRIGDRFPLAMPWKPAAMLPVLTAAVVLLALLWNPQFDANRAEAGSENQPTADAKDAIEEQMKKLAQAKPEKKAEEQPKAEKLKEIEAEIEKFTRKPRESRDEIQERIKDATAIEAELQRQQKQAAERADALREAMKQAERLTRKNRKQQEGPGKNAADALARGDMSKAKEELERLSREMEKQDERERLKRKIKDAKTPEEKEQLERELNELGAGMSEKDKEDLKKQMEEMKDMAERLSRKQEDLEKELKEMAEKGEIDKEELERELEELKKNELTEEEKKDLEELAEALKECEQCMKEGKDGKEAAKKLAKAAKKCEGMCKDGQNAERAGMQARMQAVRKALNRSMVKGGGVGSGKRPEAKSDTGHEEKTVKGEWDPKMGKATVVGDGPKGGRKFDGPKNPAELKEEIKQAEQEAAAAIDRQRLPPSARKMARDYFEQVRGKDKAKDQKK